VSDQLSTYGTKVIVVTQPEAAYVLDEILGNQTDLPIAEHATDTSRSRSRSVRSPWPNLLPVPTRPAIPTTGPVDRIAFSELRLSSMHSHSTRTRYEPTAAFFAAVVAAGRKAQGARSVDLLIAATALATGLPLYTRNGEDFRALDDLLEIIVV